MKILASAAWVLASVAMAAAQEASAPSAATPMDAAMPTGLAATVRNELALDRVQLLQSRLLFQKRELISLTDFGAGSAEADLMRNMLLVDSKLTTLQHIKAQGQWATALADSDVQSWLVYQETATAYEAMAYLRIDPGLGEYADHFKGAGNAPDVLRNIPRISWLVGITADFEGQELLGTAFHVHEGWFLTAAHVLRGRVDNNLEAFCATAPDPKDIVPEQVLAIDLGSVRFHPKLDACRFRLREAHAFDDPPLVLDFPICKCEPKPGPVPCHRAGIAGYGAGSIFPVMTVNALVIDSDGQTIRGLGTTWHCYSGGPLLAENGSIAGLMIEQADEDRAPDGSVIILPANGESAFTALSFRALAGFPPIPALP